MRTENREDRVPTAAAGGCTERWLASLSDYVDGDLSARRRRAVERHLDACTGCAGLVADLRRLAADAPALRIDSPPSRDLWPGIAERLAPRARARATSWLSLPAVRLVPRWTVAAAAAATILIAAALWVWQPDRASRATGVPAATSRGGAAGEHDVEYEKHVASLEREARARLASDPRLVGVLEENLATLDVAMANYREALAEAPGDERLRGRLGATRQRKLAVLQQAVALAPEGTN